MPTYSAVVLPQSASYVKDGILEVSAEDRARTIINWEKTKGELIPLQFPRGNHLRAGDYIQITELSLILQVVAKAEQVLTITAADSKALLRAAYHLGNRHVPLEINSSWLRLHPDPVIEKMLLDMDVTITPEIVPFMPESGAYQHHH